MKNYSAFVVMYEFYRLWRGEAFYAIRPTDLGDYQNKIYQMEDSLAKKLTEVKEKLKTDSKASIYSEQWVLTLFKRYSKICFLSINFVV